MPEYKFVEVSVTELLEGLNQLTDNRSLSHSLLDEIIQTYQIEVEEALQVRDGKKTPEKVIKDRKKRNDSRYHTRTLLKNMLAANRIQPNNTSPHHIVAWNDYRAGVARAILRQVKIDVDNEVNGVFLPMYKRHTPHPDLPDAYAHLIVHTNMYYLNITNLLEDERGNREGIEEVLRDIAEELTDRNFPIHEKIKEL